MTDARHRFRQAGITSGHLHLLSTFDSNSPMVNQVNKILVHVHFLRSCSVCIERNRNQTPLKFSLPCGNSPSQRCSTRINEKNEWTSGDLNPGPLPCEGSDLPLIYWPATDSYRVSRLNLLIRVVGKRPRVAARERCCGHAIGVSPRGVVNGPRRRTAIRPAAGWFRGGSVLEDDLDRDVVRDLDPHELSEGAFVGVDVDEPFVDAHLPVFPRRRPLSVRGLTRGNFERLRR